MIENVYIFVRKFVKEVYSLRCFVIVFMFGFYGSCVGFGYFFVISEVGFCF